MYVRLLALCHLLDVQRVFLAPLFCLVVGDGGVYSNHDGTGRVRVHAARNEGHSAGKSVRRLRKTAI